MVKISDKTLRKKAEQALFNCLERVPFLKIQNIEKEITKKESNPDFIVKLELPQGEQHLVIEIENNGQPRLARGAVNRLQRYCANLPDSYGVFIAPYISPKAAEICSKEHIGYVDLSGNCLLSFEPIYIEQTGKPNLFAQKRDLRSLYSPRAERVLRVLLNQPGTFWKVKDLVAEARVSLGQVSNVKKLLHDREWIHISSDGFGLSEPEQLLTEWTENYNFRSHHMTNFYSLKKISEIEADIAEICHHKGLRYALTGFSGAVRLAPAVRYRWVSIYIEETEEDIASLLHLKEVPSGANVSLLIPYDEGVFYNTCEIDDVHIVSPVQLYLDLIGIRGRGEEAANAILEEVIQPQW